VLALGVASCNRGATPAASDSTVTSALAGDASLVATPASTALGAPRAGMAWIPAGVLKAGTPPGKIPRIPDEELPGTEIPLGGFYIDLLAYPNEPGAIPTTNVTRDEAARLCEAKGKRQCTELEWERACKGPENTTYEYGNDYRASTCGTGVAVERASKRPMGEKVACKSAFGALEMHGGAWEWTGSTWGRSVDKELGVLRGGNAVAGELVGRCANGIARPLSTKGAQMGFRCCAGAKNDVRVELAIANGPPLERSAKPDELAAPLEPLADAAWKPAGPLVFSRAWTWRPMPNEELIVGSACAKERWWMSCGLVVARADKDKAKAKATLVAQFEAGFEAPELALYGEPRKIRARGMDAQGAFVRDLVYTYGRVDVSEAKR
jgi:formylglycine-generating enzyme required for sulfatase activity